MQMTLEHIQPLLDQLADGEVDDASLAISALAEMDIELEGWRAIDGLVRDRMADDLTGRVTAAATALPLAGLKRDLVALAQDKSDPRAAGTRQRLLEARDPLTLAAELDDLVATENWELVMAASASELARLASSTWDQPENNELFFLVASAKAGQLTPLNRAFKRAEQGELPELLWGNPMYVASLLRPACPIPESVVGRIRQAHAESEFNNLIGSLVEGLLGEQVY